MADPDVSLRSVRVSDTVTTNTRTRAGAADLCSSLLTAPVYAAVSLSRVGELDRRSQCHVARDSHVRLDADDLPSLDRKGTRRRRDFLDRHAEVIADWMEHAGVLLAASSLANDRDTRVHLQVVDEVLR